MILKENKGCKLKNNKLRFQGNEFKYVVDVLKSGFKAGSDGAYTTRLENLFNKSHNTPYSVAMNSGTSTLHSTLMALNLKKGDEVAVPALTPLMCGLSIYLSGATPLYINSDKNTFLMDPEDLKRKISHKTKVVMPVHMYGGVCNMIEIEKISKKFNLFILEDCAQCWFGEDERGKISGTMGMVGSWSFENSKQLSCGDGGIISCKNKTLAKKIRKIAGLGFKTLSAESGKVRTDKNLLQNPNWSRFDTIGLNYRLNQLGASVALAQLEKYNYYINLRIKMASEYKKIIGKSELLKPQYKPKNYKYTYYTYSCLFNGIKHNIKWSNFRRKYMEFKGDGIYAASQLLYQEPAFKNKKIGYKKNGTHRTIISEYLQKNLMNFTTNQRTSAERDTQTNALHKTLKYFGDYC